MQANKFYPVSTLNVNGGYGDSGAIWDGASGALSHKKSEQMFKQ